MSTKTFCDECGNEIPGEAPITVNVEGVNRQLCCRDCLVGHAAKLKE